MGSDDCPLCLGPLHARRVTPCEKCGADPESHERFAAGDQTYHLVKIINDQELVLCVGCMVGFGFIDSEFLGVPVETDYGFEHMEVVREIPDPSLRSDGYCPACEYRLRFLRFVRDVRSIAP